MVVSRTRACVRCMLGRTSTTEDHRAMTTTGIIVTLLHPGEMGSAVGATLVASGARTSWVSAGRSAASHDRAEELGLHELATLDDAVRQSRVIVSVVPPHGALDTARSVAAAGFRGIYVDANAVAPD